MCTVARDPLVVVGSACMGMRACGVALLGVLTMGCDTDVDSPFTAVSAGGTGTATATDSTASASTSSGGPSGSESTTAAPDATTTSGTTPGSSGAPSTSGDPCNPDPCVAPQVCMDGVCVGVTAPGVGDVVFTEMMPNPDLVTDEAGEWIEVLNLSAAAVELDGCELADQGSDSHTISGSVVIDPGGFAVLGRADAANGGVTLDYAYGSDISLGNDGDEIALRCAGTLVDEVVYTSGWPYGTGSAAQLDPAAGAANDELGQWCQATTAYGDGDLGTPGAANNPC